MTKLYGLDPSDASRLLGEGKLSVGVFGFGHVGLPLGIVWCKAGAKVIGVTKDREHINMISRGESPFPEEKGLADRIKECLKAGRLTITDDTSLAASQTDLQIIAVPIPFDPSRGPDFSALEDVGAHIGRSLKKGGMVDLESSVPPGTTRGVLKPLLELHSELKEGEDFGLVYSPERIFVGRALEDLVENYPKVIGSDSEQALRIMSALYGRISKRGVVGMSSTSAAELEKLFEGVYRDVNIALANELAELSSELGVSYYEARNAANSQKYCHLHVPGVGVGGFCIPIYSRYVIDRARKSSVPVPIVELARKSNEDLPGKRATDLIDLMMKAKIKVKAAKVAVLGLSFRGNTGDTRLSPSLDLIQRLAPEVSEIAAFDPIASRVQFKYENVRRAAKLDEALSGASSVCVAVEHDEFAKLTFDQLAGPLKRPAVIVDYKGIVKGDKPKDRGVVCKVIGEPVTE